MTKHEAYLALLVGAKVTHPVFNTLIWVQKEGEYLVSSNGFLLGKLNKFLVFTWRGIDLPDGWKIYHD